MAATPTTTFPSLLAPGPPHPAARPSFSTLRTPSISLSLSYSLPGRLHRQRLAAFSRDTTSNKGQEQEQEPAPSAGAAEAADGGAEKSTEAEGASPGEKSPEAVAAELKEVLRARKESETAEGGGGWWAGVAQEMSEIEWPAPRKVVGTTGVVLGVIAGSTVALLSVNALLAELSDRVFAGRGLQDFFG
ncbi:preprotein translocase subunit SECE1 [Setaria italica]|uniref:preprotein translocase subunit SECE1 n=1 Tax=Setaria italica TaxID=4555 RepID=UPI0003509E4B|nr:preprotein translocase subunit SECE1 [Setaria italica]